MKNIFKSIVFFNLLICALFIFFPQRVNAQVSQEMSQPADIARLFRGARIQFVNQQTVPHDFTLPFLNGASASLSSYKGKVVLLNFWATWCPPCRAEMSSMEIFYKRYKNKGLEILAVDIGEDTNTVRQFIQSNAYTFPVMLDSGGKVGGMYGVRGIPTTYIIDKEGKIIGMVSGSIEWDTPQVFAAFDALLDGR